jgi:hypothetical protein
VAGTTMTTPLRVEMKGTMRMGKIHAGMMRKIYLMIERMNVRMKDRIVIKRAIEMIETMKRRKTTGGVGTALTALMMTDNRCE